MNFFKKLFAKKTKTSSKVTLTQKKKPSMSKQIKIMQNKNLTYNMEVINVLYSRDKTIRFVLLKRKDGKFTIKHEKLYIYDEKTLNSLPANSLPGYWEPSSFSVALFKTEESALEAIKKEDDYKNHFENSTKK